MFVFLSTISFTDGEPNLNFRNVCNIEIKFCSVSKIVHSKWGKIKIFCAVSKLEYAEEVIFKRVLRHGAEV